MEQGFADALERAVAANPRVQLIHFPKAYRSTEESEMVLDGLVSADPNAWSHTADLFVWGTYSHLYQPIPGKPAEQRLEITLHQWDGASQPTVVKEGIAEKDTAGAMEAAVERLAAQVVGHARKRMAQADSGLTRKQIAQSLVETYDGMTKRFGKRQGLGLQDSTKFLQAIQLLETACFIDPDNEEARLSYICCRWGFWMEFGKVKNPFWSNWRRSQAWGKYVERFGLKPVKVELPFPYDDVRSIYGESIDKVLKLFPQWHSAEQVAMEAELQRLGVHTWLKEAEAHGFPRDMPAEMILTWRREIKTEYWKRLTRIANTIKSGWPPENNLPVLNMPDVVASLFDATTTPSAEQYAVMKTIWPGHIVSHRPDGRELPPGTVIRNNADRRPAPPSVVAPGPPLPTVSWPEPAKAPTNTIRTPRWFEELTPAFAQFHLAPPTPLPLTVNPTARAIRFPPACEVQRVTQMTMLQDKLLILAMEKTTRQSSDAQGGIAADLLEERNRLWLLDPAAETPILYQPQLLPQHVSSFLLDGEALWIAGQATGVLDLRTTKFRRFGLEDGLELQRSAAIASADGRIFAAGDRFKISVMDLATQHWNNLPLPPGRYSGSSQAPGLLAGRNRAICYAAGTVMLRDLSRGEWAQLAEIQDIRQIVPGDTGMWFACRDGLRFSSSRTRQLKHWPAPIPIQGMRDAFGTLAHPGNRQLSQALLEKLEGVMRDVLKKGLDERERNRAARKAKPEAADPLRLDWNIPGELTALADDGDLLWIGAASSSGNYLLALHKPTASLVGCCALPVRDRICSLAVSTPSVWVGTAYGDRQLLQLSKDAFLSVPKSRWVPLGISPAERKRLVEGMSVRDQAMYAYYSADDARVLELLGNINPDNATREEMFLLAFSCNATGLDKPELAHAWFQRIVTRYPDSPWSRAAEEAMVASDERHQTRARERDLLAKFDRNHDGVLDPKETAVMQKDAAYQRENRLLYNEKLGDQIKQIFNKYDRDKNGTLNAAELQYLRSQAIAFAEATPEYLATHKVVLAPLVSRRFPAVETLLKKYDANGDGNIDPAELKTCAEEMDR